MQQHHAGPTLAVNRGMVHRADSGANALLKGTIGGGGALYLHEHSALHHVQAAQTFLSFNVKVVSIFTL